MKEPEESDQETLCQQIAEWNARWVAGGGKLATYACPGCGGRLTAPVPKTKGEVWDGVALCAHCKKPYYRAVWGVSGKLKIRAL